MIHFNEQLTQADAQWVLDQWVSLIIVLHTQHYLK